MAISHADHNHPNTPAARAVCRKRLANGQSPFDASAERAFDNHTSPVADKIDAAFPVVTDVVRGKRGRKITPRPTRTVVDPGVDADTNADNVPGPGRIRRARSKVNTSDMPRNIRTACDWANNNGCTWVGVEHRAGQVTIEITGPAGTASIAYARDNAVGVQAVSFRPNGTSVTSRVTSINEVLRMVKG